MEPIHWREPTNDGCLSPTSTKAWNTGTPTQEWWCHHLLHWKKIITWSAIPPAGSLCEWARIAPHSPAAGTRSRWFEVSDTHSPSRCRPYGPACSDGSCRCPAPSTPARQTFLNMTAPHTVVTVLEWHMWDCAVPFHPPGWDEWGPDVGFVGNHLCRAHQGSGMHWLFLNKACHQVGDAAHEGPNRII